MPELGAVEPQREKYKLKKPLFSGILNDKG